MGLLKKMFPSDNDRNLKKIEKIAALVEAKSDEYAKKTDEELKQVTTDLKQRLQDGQSLEQILPDAYAAVREASVRVIGLRHYHVQIMGGIALFQGRIAEMRTGEGKTLVETLPAYLQALEGKGVHIVTVNEYLAKRDAEWMGKIFVFLGLTVGYIYTQMNQDEKRKAYLCDITYGTNNEFGFDYLRDNMVVKAKDRVAREYNFAIVDEVDSILIDEARTPLIISGRGTKSNELYVPAAQFAKQLKPIDYEIDAKEKVARLTDDGIRKAEAFFKVDNISDISHIELNHHIRNAMQAQFIMIRDENYIVKDGEVVIVDEFTGRLMQGRKFSNGLHQAIEAKEGVEIKDENKTLATVTFQNFFRLYRKLSGMTGTAKTEEMEFNKIYNLDVVCIPTNLPILREDFPDVVYKNEEAKFNAIVEHVKEVHATGRPVLVGTVTIEKSERLSKALKQQKVSHFVLNAKNHQQESEIVAQAGRLGQVTIATNMAGRGTDILLGGNPEFLAKQKMRELGVTDAQLEYCTSLLESGNEELNELRKKYNKYYAEYKAQTDKEKTKVKSLGGLHIVGTERHESRRIDNQLRGRAGRQGDPGSSLFFVSMDDELLRRFGGETMQNFMSMLNMDENMPLQYKMLSRRIEGAQRRIEGYNFSARHNVLLYDDVLNAQRNIIYAQRNKVLDGVDIHEEVLDMIEELVVNTVLDHIDDNVLYDKWDLEELNSALNGRMFELDTNFVTPEFVDGKESEEVAYELADIVIQNYENKMKEIEKIGLKPELFEGHILLRVVDSHWMDHIDYMNMLRNEIGLRGYGNHDPVVAYKEEGFAVFDDMVSKIRSETALFVIRAKLNIKIEPKKPVNMVTNQVAESNAKSTKVVGRNDPCPCGSGKKYKNCHGKAN